MIQINSKGKSAQELMGEILQKVHHIGQYTEWNQMGRWSDSPDFCYWEKPVHELDGKTIGSIQPLDPQFTQIARAFGLHTKTVSHPADCYFFISGEESAQGGTAV